MSNRGSALAARHLAGGPEGFLLEGPVGAGPSTPVGLVMPPPCLQNGLALCNGRHGALQLPGSSRLCKYFLLVIQAQKLLGIQLRVREGAAIVTGILGKTLALKGSGPSVGGRPLDG